MLADIWTGETATAEVFFLVALILFLIGGFIAFQAQAIWATLVAVGLAAVALAWMLL
jgi:hypothetical protein